MTDDPGFHPETLSTYEPTPEEVAARKGSSARSKFIIPAVITKDAYCDLLAAYEGLEEQYVSLYRDNEALGVVNEGLRGYASELREELRGVRDAVTRVHERIGLGVDITTWIDGTVEIRWRRDYGEAGWSDERWGQADSLEAALELVLRHEDSVDREEGLGT